MTGTGGFRTLAGFVPSTGLDAVVLANDLRSGDRGGVDLSTLSAPPGPGRS